MACAVAVEGRERLRRPLQRWPAYPVGTTPKLVWSGFAGTLHQAHPRLRLHVLGFGIFGGGQMRRAERCTDVHTASLRARPDCVAELLEQHGSFELLAWYGDALLARFITELL